MHAFDSLGELLVELQVLRLEQWRQLRPELPADADLSVVLERLAKLPAWWSADGSTPALTDYQRKWIKRLYERNQTGRLKKALRWGDYLILSELGEGGMGVVFKGWDLPEGRPVAIKRIKGNSADTYRRFRREARIQKHLSHPRIAHFLKLTRFKGATLLVLEYIDGRTMNQEVKARGPIPWREAVRWILDILHALEYVHRLKIIHRDLKPSNIILHGSGQLAVSSGQLGGAGPSARRSARTRDSHELATSDGGPLSAKLLDLGLAKCLDPSALPQATIQDALTVGDAILGTFEYMAPEQWRGAEEIVPASDIYSLGCTLFFALTGGKPPFVANSLVAYCNAHTSLPPPRLSEVQPGLPSALDALVQQMLSKDPARRGTPAQLIKQFSNLLRQEPEEVVRPKRTSVDADTPRPFRPPMAPPRQPSDTAAPQRPMALPSVAGDDRFSPFPSSTEVNVSGLRAVWRALLAPPWRLTRMLSAFLIFAIVIAAGLLLLWQYGAH